jgi:hypothetical protein
VIPRAAAGTGQPTLRQDGEVDTLLDARARVLADLEAQRLADAATVSLLEEAVSERGWWAEQWPQGAVYVVGLVAQDVQDALLDGGRRWPACTLCDDSHPLHTLNVSPDIGGPDPVWVCEERGEIVAAVGSLPEPD